MKSILCQHDSESMQMFIEKEETH